MTRTFDSMKTREKQGVQASMGNRIIPIHGVRWAHDFVGATHKSGN